MALVGRLSHSGWLHRVRRGAYVVRARSTTLRLGALELVGELSPDFHMVTAGKALELHELSEQTYRRIVVLVARPFRDWEWSGESIQYARVDTSRIWGGKGIGKGEHRTIVAGPERAIVDSVARPAWGVTLPQIAHALLAVRRRNRYLEKLAQTVARYRNASAARRIGFLIEQIHGAEVAAPFLSLRGASNSLIPLVSGGEKNGLIDTRWRIRINVPLDLVLEGSS
jgi:predicted transcriptional regulator of viral defense system